MLKVKIKKFIKTQSCVGFGESHVECCAKVSLYFVSKAPDVLVIFLRRYCAIQDRYK